MLTDKKKKRPLKLSPKELENLVDELVGDGLPEGIFGVLDNNIDRAEAEAAAHKARRPKKIQPKKLSVLPKMKINQPTLPEEAIGQDVTNVVSVPATLLKRIARGIDTRTAEINSLLLTELIPLLLSYDTGTKYARAAMKDGLNVEIDFDEGLGEAVKNIGYLNLLFFFIKKSKLPKALKKKYMYRFSDALAAHTLSAILDANKVQDRHKMTQELQAVVSLGQTKKTTVHTSGDKKSEDDKPIPSDKGRNTPIAAIKRGVKR